MMKTRFLIAASVMTISAIFLLYHLAPASAAGTFSADSIDRLGRTESDMKQKYGEPLSTEVSNVRNPHWPDVIDKKVEYRYEKISFLFYRPSQTPDRTILMHITVTDPAMTFGDLRVGSARGEVEAALGCGTQWEDDLGFEDDDGLESLNIRFDKKE